MAAREASTTTLSLERFAADARALVAGAQALADEQSHAEVEPIHFLSRALARDAGVRAVFTHAGVDAVELQAAAERALEKLPKSNEPSYLSAAMLDFLERAQRESKREQSDSVQVEHLLNALSQEIRGRAGELLGAYRVGPGALRGHTAALHSVPRTTPRPSGRSVERYTRSLVDRARAGELGPVIGRAAELRRLLTILERRQKNHPLLVGEPGVGKSAIVTALAMHVARGDVPTSLASARLFELDAGALVAGARLRGEIEERVQALVKEFEGGQDDILVIQQLEQLFGQGAVGAAIGDVLKPALGQGKLRVLGTTTPEGLRRLQDRDPAALRLFTLLEVAEPSVDEAIEIVRGIASRYEAHHHVQINEGAIVSAVRLAKRYVQDRFLPDSAIDLLDEATAARRVEIDGTPAAIDRKIRRLDSLKSQLQTLEHSTDAASTEARERLAAELSKLEPEVQGERERLEVRRGAVAAVRTLRAELDKAKSECERARAEGNLARVGELEHVTIGDLEERLAKAEQAAESAGGHERVLDEQGVAETLALWTGIPVAKMLEGEADKLLKMEERLSQRVVGQAAAVTAIAKAVRRGRAGLRDPGKPIGSFLFLGPSGVGKTELAKALAQFLFDDEHALTRLDMSEFMERHMAQRLIGAPPGYADSEQGGFLTEAVRRRPYSVLLFDEVEKAHQDVFNLLLQVLDDGRLTDGRGRLADFSNTVVIMTSNIGSDRILDTEPKLFETEDGRQAVRDVLLTGLGEFFRPEFLNRIDDVLVFRPLSREHLRAIVDIQLERVEGLLQDRKLRLELSEAAKTQLVELGYEPALGARPLRRALIRHIQDPLAERLLAGSIADGGTIRVDWGDNAFSFS